MSDKNNKGHVLYTDEDFTNEEYHRSNQLAVLVIDGGVQICKKCGESGSALDQPCKRMTKALVKFTGGNDENQRVCACS